MQRHPKERKRGPKGGPTNGCRGRERQSTIQNAFAAQARVVTCVICGETVKMQLINHHLDNSCSGVVSEADVCVVSENEVVKSEAGANRSRLPRCTVDDVASVSCTSSATLSTSSRSSLELDCGRSDASIGALKESTLDSGFDEGDLVEETEKESVFQPYYLKFFDLVCTSVLDDPLWAGLLSPEEDRRWMDVFRSLPEIAQKLYVRLFLRRRAWVSESKISYADISEDVHRPLRLLVERRLLIAGDSIDDFEEVFKLLSLPGLQSVCKSFKVGSCGDSKQCLKQSLLKFVLTQPSLFGGSMKSQVLKRIHKELGCLYQVAEQPASAFRRMFTLFAMPDLSPSLLIDNVRLNLHQTLLFKLLQVDRGELRMPAYVVNCKAKLFPDRETFLLYMDACTSETDALVAASRGHLDSTVSLAELAMTQFEAFFASDRGNYLENVPCCLRRYSAAWVWLRVVAHGVEALEKQRDYHQAVVWLRWLLKQSERSTLSSSRWRWWERLTLNLDVHLRRPVEAFEAVLASIRDPLLRPQAVLGLFDRGCRIVDVAERRKNGENAGELTKNRLLRCLESVQKANVAALKLNEKTIDGTLARKSLGGERKRTLFVSSSDSGTSQDYEVHNVEQVALDYYLTKEDFAEGFHDEGGALLALFGVLFWREIFMDVPNAFVFRVQTEPLDMNCPEFFHHREQVIHSRLESLRLSSVEEICTELRAMWTEFRGTSCSLVNWDLFLDVAQAERLLTCIGARILCDVCEYLAKDYRYRRSGLPDLIVWNARTGAVKVSEVKGPGDRLSTKQRVWLDKFISIGMDAEVCYVRGVSAKRV